MRRIQIYIDEVLDDRLGAEAGKHGVSKAWLIRDAVAAKFPPTPETVPEDPWQSLVGWLDDEPVADIDSVIYGAPR